jgi:hypothetical protein
LNARIAILQMTNVQTEHAIVKGKSSNKSHRDLPALVLLLLDLCSAGAAAARTSGHLNLTCTPVDLRVMLTEPGVSQYHVLVAKAGHSKLSTLCVVLVPENNIYHLTDGPRFIGRAINIVHWDGACKGSGSELVLPYIVTVNEKSVSSAVKEGLHGLGLQSVSCHNLDLDVQGVQRGGRGDHILPWKPSFPTFQADWVSWRGLRSWWSFWSWLHVFSNHFICQIY